jgi:hypothetical protein
MKWMEWIVRKTLSHANPVSLIYFLAHHHCFTCLLEEGKYRKHVARLSLFISFGERKVEPAQPSYVQPVSVVVVVVVLVKVTFRFEISQGYLSPSVSPLCFGISCFYSCSVFLLELLSGN